VVEQNKNASFTPGDMKQLREIICEVINDRSKYDCMRKHAMDTATNYYPESIKSELEKLYAEIS
jgi:hypothetical protein